MVQLCQCEKEVWPAASSTQKCCRNVHSQKNKRRKIKNKM